MFELTCLRHLSSLLRIGKKKQIIISQSWTGMSSIEEDKQVVLEFDEKLLKKKNSVPFVLLTNIPQKWKARGFAYFFINQF